MSHFTKPLIALILGVLPFFLFLGTASTTVVNGDVVADSRFNLGGLVMALIGVGLAWTVLSERGPRPIARKLLAGLAGLICALQLVSSTDLWRIDPLDWLMPDRHLPATEYSGPSENDRIVLLPESEENYRSTLAHNKAEIIRNARLHHTYATLCHGGRSRIDLVRAETLPDFFDPDLQDRIGAGVARMSVDRQVDCNERQSVRMMVALADETNRQMDMFDRLAADYLRFSQEAP